MLLKVENVCKRFGGQVPTQVLLQQTPSVQTSLRHSSPTLQLKPLACLGAQVLAAVQ